MDGVEARVVWRLQADAAAVNGETDVQLDDSMAFVGEHVLDELELGLSELEKRR